VLVSVGSAIARTSYPRATRGFHRFVLGADVEMLTEFLRRADPEEAGLRLEVFVAVEFL
jgi:hypothetical protein